ncbi:amidoligase family protein [bacterium]|nr:amidoligase family protein [bacterium]
MITIQEQNFGVEIELAGAPRRSIAEAVATALDARITATHQSGYDATIVTDNQGREWKIMNDSSIPIINGYKGSEIVTPILCYEDIETLQKVIRKVRSTGALAPKSAAIHCHISAAPHNAKSLSILAKMVHKNEDMIFDALQVHPDRRRRYARPMDSEFIEKVARRRPQSKEKLNEMWFGRYLQHPTHYENHRYKALNYNNLYRAINTIEFRFPNSTLHAGKIRSYVQLFLAISAKALNARSASHRKIQTDNPKFNFRVWLVSTLGMKGDEFKTARYHLTRYLPGNSAWRYGPPTISNNSGNS